MTSWYTPQTTSQLTEKRFTKSSKSLDSTTFISNWKSASSNRKKVEFLGVILEKETVQMDPTKTKGIADWKTPQNLKDVRTFLGFTGFYRYFVPNYSKIARPLIELTKKAVPFHWDEAQCKAFETLKSLMCSHPVLKQPDYTKPFFLSTDASAYGVGAVDRKSVV